MRLPEGWTVAKFGQVVQIANGQVSPLKEPYLSYIHIGPENIESNSGRLLELHTAAQLGLKSGKYLFDENSLVYSKIRPNLNKVCRPNFCGICSADAYPLWPLAERLHRNFLFQYMLSTLFVSQTVAVSTRSGMPKINRQDLCAVNVILPPLSEQEKIAGVLDAWDETIRQHSTLIRTKSNFKKGLMQQLLTGKRRFKEFVSSKETHKTIFGSLPLDWEYPKIGEIAHEVSERNSECEEIPVLSCTKYDGLVDSLSYFGKRIFSEDTSGYKVVRCGQFAYATNHIEEGSIGLLHSLDAGLVSPMYTVFATGSQIYAPFLYKVFKTGLYTHIFSVNTNATVDRRGSLRWSQFKNLHVPLPSLQEQKKISGVFDALDKEISLLKKQLEALKLQKMGLMQKLLTGQIQVKAREVKSNA